MSRPYKVVVMDYEFHELLFEEKVLFELPNVTLVKGNTKTESEVIELVKEADAVNNQYAPLNANIVESMDRCKVISHYGVGVDTVDLEKATKKGFMFQTSQTIVWKSLIMRLHYY